MPSLGETLGAIELGVLFASILYGVLLVQVYNYYQRNFTDGLSVKILLYTVATNQLWLLIRSVVESVHMVFIMAFIFHATVTDYGVLAPATDNHNGTTEYEWEQSFVWPLAFSVRLSFFFAQITRLSRRWWLALISWSITIIHLGAVIAASIIATRIGDLFVFLQKHTGLMIFGQGSGLFVDVFNTVCLCSLLWTRRSEFNHICTMLLVVLVATKEHNTIWMVFMLISARLYSNSLMATLNGRSSLLQSAKIITRGELTATALRGDPSATGHAIEVHVDIQHDNDERMTHGEVGQHFEIELGSLQRDDSNEGK
ncbi:uncharacterized protein STEHIDRAFT_107411 [Stereum hirsutum FP-91666 SS1]|uniref:uncharacterized protein n=1 Tax=Stereum hirsutum (strain FP-91666) TaxID=721885 RepID=UPI000440D668|nr:uncharacterized protein STEHIDRAFT_107411 [Stereum hirsutum FP-91666 SS1]EIM90638.1 hypothetical protein STEHIDRAFT_107411 [Stereum hirsutum FP-91666 SS1]